MSKITLTKEQFKLLNAAVKSAIATNGVRPMLQYAKLEIEKGQIKVIALDGYKMTVLTFKGADTEPETFTCYYQPVSLPSKTRTVTIESVEGAKTCKIYFYGESTISMKEIPQHEGDWLRWGDLMTRVRDNKTAVCVDPKLLIEALHAHSSATMVKIKLAPKGDWVNPVKPLILESETPLSETETMLMPLKGW